MQASTSNPKQQGGQNEYEHDYTSMNADEDIDMPDQNVNEKASVEVENDSGHNEGPLKAKRQRRSTVWEDIIEVTLPNGIPKVQCIHCKTHLSVSKGKPTTAWKRHMDGCLKRQQFMQTQRMLNFKPVDVDTTFGEPTPLMAFDAKYDPIKMRESIANWLMATEQPFNTVENDMFVYMMKTANPKFEKLSRNTIKADCFKVYDHEKKKLKGLLRETSNISITTDCWKSSHQKIEYMVITGHFIDKNWRLQKRVLSFVHVPPPRTGLDIAHGIYNCLKEWEIEGKIFSISVDNAAYNDRVVSTLKNNFSRVKKLPCGGRLFHVRCCAHILNLLVKDGLSKIDYVIEEVREAVKYINYSEARRQMFANAAEQLQVHDRKLMIDVPTRWNSTYEMLSLAINFKDVFPRYAEYEPHFKHLPTEQDWTNVKNVCEMLDASIKEATSQKSGSSTGSTTSKPNEETSSSEWDAFGEFLKDDEVVITSKSEVEVYLEEGVLQGNDKVNLNVLDWWNTHKLKYRVLSTLASDILAVPISTVASEATFSAGGRVIDPFRSTLAPTTVEMLLCGGDWIRQKYGIKKKLKVCGNLIWNLDFEDHDFC
ncbi:hypothetical protein QVD17_19698 [Tagetes erecta]|uniref:HAT C-terminal dimerisation domain-containing protein n=1 Tax=Tagetes erecta TaxID=13708 RepID=A0AAD8NXF5_TARER|nr:hypothetical protein QVD17_19698 [Tagetes erecta]